MIDPLSLRAWRITVIAPHPDDETLGCGGLIAALVADLRAVQTLFITDGAGSHPNSAAWPPERLIAQRRSEAEEALVRLGAGDQPRAFMDLPDAGAPGPDDPGGEVGVQTLAQLLSAFGPELVLAPWRRDPHCDHRAAWSLTHAALVRAGLQPDVLEYAVWLDELGAPEDFPVAGEAKRVDFDIRDVATLKRHAVQAHLSQTTDLIGDDPDGFRLSASTLDRLIGETETYWRASS